LAALGAALIFPLILLFLPLTIIFLILAMIVWGVYYEFSQFSHFNFVHAFLTKEEHAHAWGVISVFKATAYIVGPLLAGWLIGLGMNFAFKTVLVLVAVGFLGLAVFLKRNHKGQKTVGDEANHPGFWQELAIWRTLMAKVWPLWLFILAVFLIDASFWSVGTVLSEQLRQVHPLGGLLLPLYMLPSLLVGWLADKASRPWGKKRVAFLAGMSYGLLLLVVGLMPSPVGLLALVLIASTLGAVAVPEILAVFQDFVARSGVFGNEVISLERSAENLAYILGPVLAGGIALVMGFQETFTVMGGILFLAASLAFLVVPRKIRLPQQELEKI
jgi:hypothetical protein